MTLNVAIIGGGLGGLATALFLKQAGINATVFEAVLQIREIGAGIVVPPNMVRPIDALGLSDQFQQTAVQLETAWEFRRWQDGRVLFSQPMGKRCVELYGTHCYVAHRADILNMLMDALPAGQLKLDHRCTHIDEQPDGVELKFDTSTGKTIRTKVDLVIGADGIHSIVRPHVTTADKPRYSGLSAFRCLVPADVAPEIALRPVQTLWIGPGRHFVHYPISGGSLINIVAFIPDEKSRTESWTTDSDVEELAREYSDWDPRIQEMIATATDTKLWSIYDRAPLANWSTDRVTLLGDAAHAMLPFFAQGAAQAIEDAVVLAQCVKSDLQKFDKVKQPSKSIAESLARYEAIRRPRTREVQLMSRGREVRNHLPDGPEQQARDAELANGDPLKQSSWLYGHNVLDSP